MRYKQMVITQDRKRCRIRLSRAQFELLAKDMFSKLKEDPISNIFTMDFQDDMEKPIVN